MHEIVSAELRAAGLLFAAELAAIDKAVAQGSSLIGAGYSFSSDGLLLDGNGNVRYPRAAALGRASFAAVVEFTYNAGAQYYLFDLATATGTDRTFVHVTVAGDVEIRCGASIQALTILNANWTAAFIAGSRNTLVLSLTSGDNKAWLNGTLVATSATAWSTGYPATTTLGAGYDDSDRFQGTIHRAEFYGTALATSDEEYLRKCTLLTKLNDSLLVLPLQVSYNRVTDGLCVTPTQGRSSVTEARMGSDGATVAEFPTFIQPRGVSCNGDDLINIGDSTNFTFSTGANDLPFSVALLIQEDSLANDVALLTKADSLADGEWGLYYDSSGRVAMAFVDDTSGGYRARMSPAGQIIPGVPHVIVATYSGSGAPLTGACVYVDGARVDNTSATLLGYTCMRNTAVPVLVSSGLGFAHVTGWLALPTIYSFELTAVQVRALTARMLAHWRTA